MEAALADDHLIQGKPIAENSNIVSKQVLLFNCMDVRDPQVLLPKLLKTRASSGTHFSKTLFVPSLSTYGKVTPGASAISSNLNKDLSWQFNLHRLLGEDAWKGAVMLLFPLTIKWLRDCVNKHPSVRVDVLVTGSLHLVGETY